MNRKYLISFLLLLPSLFVTALEVEFSGEFRSRGVFVHNKDLDNSTSGKVALIDSRLRLWMTPKIREDLKVIFGIEVGDVSWGEEVGSFTLDNNLGKASGGAQGTDGVNIETKHAYMEYSPKGLTLQIGLLPFAAPCQFVIDSDLAAITFQWKMFGLKWTALYARAFAGPRGNGVNTLAEDASQADKGSDLINLDDDRNDFYLAAQLKNGKKLSLTGWLLFDDNRRFSQYAPTGQPLTSSQLLYAGVQTKGKSGALRYQADAVLNTGTITETGGGSVSVFAWALHLKGSYEFSKSSEVGINLRSISGNSTAQTNANATVRQFQVLDGGDGDSSSLLSLLFGGGVFNHQSMFYHKTASARTVNITTGYLVRNDPGIPSFETYFEQLFFDKLLRIRLIAGYAMTTQAVTIAGGGTSRSLGTEVDLAFRLRANKNLDFYLTLAALLPGKALGPTLALDNAALDPADQRNFGDDPAFKIEAMARVRF